MLSDIDVEKLKKSLNHYRVLFGVDDDSLESMAKDAQVSVEQLKKTLKSPYLLETKKNETLGEKLLKHLEIFASANGGLLATGRYFEKNSYLQLHFLDTVTEDAKLLLQLPFLNITKGQFSSDTSSPEDNTDLEPCFAEYLKKIKIENKIIPQETIQSIELFLQKGNIQGATSVIRDALEKINNAPINVAVTGESGAGKSSFINALRGVGPEEEGAAEEGVVETTMKRTPYKHPKIKTLTLWDLPGIGTQKFPPKDYLEKVKFQQYDFFIIVSATRFTKLELDLAKAVRFIKKNYCFVRTKVDFDLENQKKSKPRTFDREKTLKEIRSYCENTFTDNKVDVPPIFLISNHNLSDYDFPDLIETLNRDIPVLKRHNFILAMPNITETVIQRKYSSLHQLIWVEAFKFRLLATFPVDNILLDSDVENPKMTLNFYRDLFGVDDKSLELMAKDLQVPVEQLRKKLKSPYVLETEEEETLEEKLLKYLDKFSSASGGVLGTGLYFRKIFYLHFHFLDTVTEDAKVLLREAYSKN
ncbi:interferon-inducible GTPase 1-like [Acomys russatus]|uniref:interferon-inducible GTPase 1-like n=1 Tax=Acomys russatus TaxID=60746 RepID=UPI0021E1D944|nr:interferon-inducible GTPase 1-like [Acomys russatus]